MTTSAQIRNQLIQVSRRCKDERRRQPSGATTGSPSQPLVPGRFPDPQSWSPISRFMSSGEVLREVLAGLAEQERQRVEALALPPA